MFKLTLKNHSLPYIFAKETLINNTDRTCDIPCLIDADPNVLILSHAAAF